MSSAKTIATAARVLIQLSHDHRTVAIILVVPCLLLWILKYMFNDDSVSYNRLAPMMLGIFPLLMMFLVTSIATLRERTHGTLDRLMTQPISKLDFIFGYAIAFSIVGLIQSVVLSSVTLWLLGVDIQGSQLSLMVTSVAAAFLGTTMGLLVSAFAKSEFQAVELVMPTLMPQVLLCGLFVPREKMSDLLEWISGGLPLTYSVDAIKQISTHADWTTDLTRDLWVVVGFGVMALVIGSITIRRQE